METLGQRVAPTRHDNFDIGPNGEWLPAPGGLLPKPFCPGYTRNLCVLQSSSVFFFLDRVNWKSWSSAQPQKTVVYDVAYRNVYLVIHDDNITCYS